MKAICTSYNKTDKGLVLRNNWIDEIINIEHLNEFLSKFIDIKSTEYITESIKRSKENDVFRISHIIEGKMDLDNVVIHIRIIN